MAGPSERSPPVASPRTPQPPQTARNDQVTGSSYDRPGATGATAITRFPASCRIPGSRGSNRSRRPDAARRPRDWPYDNAREVRTGLPCGCRGRTRPAPIVAGGVRRLHDTGRCRARDVTGVVRPREPPTRRGEQHEPRAPDAAAEGTPDRQDSDVRAIRPRHRRGDGTALRGYFVRCGRARRAAPGERPGGAASEASTALSRSRRRMSSAARRRR